MEIDGYKKKFEEELKNSSTLPQLESLRIKYLGKKGIIRSLFSELKELSSLEKKQKGKEINEFKNYVEKRLKEKARSLKPEKKEFIDVTLPEKKPDLGSLHIITLAVEEITEIFSKLGFIKLTYPEVEWEFFSFDALNMPPGHPARDDFETFFMEAEPSKKYGRMILSPHTSSGQVREMLRVKKPPIRMINIAKCYRPNWDVTHTPMFHQFEGLCIDKDINITHLKGTIEYFVKSFFGEKRRFRLRPFHFQFTEPSFEIDISCNVCGGTGYVDGKKCKVCKSGWLELGGAGMVHPNVLKAGGIDPKKYSGWAFGFGIERTYIMKTNLKIEDIRILYSGNVSFLKLFR